jgi:type I restriction enzyme S subunit
MRPYLRAANVTWSGLMLDDVKEMNFTDAELEVYRLLPGDIVLSEASGSPGEVGKPALWQGEIDDCAFQNTLIRVRPREHTPQFLLYFLRYLALTGQFMPESRGVGINHLGRQRLASWSVPVPRVAEQRRIVEVLEDHLSRLETARGYLGHSMRRAVRLDAALRSEVRCGPERNLDEVTVIQGGIQKQQRRAPRDNAYPFLRVANVTAQGLDLSDVHRVELFGDELSRLRLRQGDLLVVEGNGSASQIGRAALWDGSIQDCVHQNHLIRVRPGPDLLPQYLEAVWNSPQTRARLTQVASSSSGLHTLSVSKLKALTLPVPDLELQRRLCLGLHESQTGLTRLTSAAREAQLRGDVLRRAVLAAAFSGQLTGRRTDNEIIEELSHV